jgi:hypothetical protein
MLGSKIFLQMANMLFAPVVPKRVMMELVRVFAEARDQRRNKTSPRTSGHKVGQLQSEFHQIAERITEGKPRCPHHLLDQLSPEPKPPPARSATGCCS